jgi:hypothetical protein
VIGGDHDAIRLNATIAIARAIRKAGLRILLDTGHPTIRERPEWPDSILRDFFEGDGLPVGQ